MCTLQEAGDTPTPFDSGASLGCSAAFVFTFLVLGSFPLTIKPNKYMNFPQGLLNSLALEAFENCESFFQSQAMVKKT